MKYVIALLSTLFSYAPGLYSQHVATARLAVDTLTSSFMWGRGYTNNGIKKAAAYIESSFSRMGLQPFLSSGYAQPFSYNVNTFPGDMEFEINGRKLLPGKEFIVMSESRSIKAKGELAQADSTTFLNQENKFIVQVANKLTWTVSQHQEPLSGVEVLRTALQQEMPTSFKVKISARLEKNYPVSNICGYVKGTSKPDSFMVITAHYDHLGGMGDATYFPGANDNASGVALLLSLAEYYSLHPAAYSIAFIAFAGEEAGLLGSKYFTQNPVFPLTQISFLLNTDLAGTGEDGITVVNATEFPQAFTLLNTINDSLHLLKKINPRGKAANSDHYHFTEKGVPAFFFYTQGGIQAYHDVYDVSRTLPLTEHEDLIKLVTTFIGEWTARGTKK